MPSDLVSVIIPVYNVAPYLKHCLDSVFKQTYTNLEIIVIDDGSTDDSGAICDAYAAMDKRVRVVHQKNAGQGPARNTGLDICKGAYLTFVDSDDFVAPDMIELLHKNLLLHNVDIAGFSFAFYEDATGTTYPAPGKGPEHVFTNAADFLTYFFTRPVLAYIWGKLYRRALFTNFRFATTTFEDVLMWAQLCKGVTSVAVNPQIEYYYRLRKGSITDHASFNLGTFALPVVWDQVRKDLAPYGSQLQELADGNFYYYAYICVLNNLCRTGNEERYKDKVQEIRQAIWKNLKEILQNSNLSCRAKGACLLALCSIDIYKFFCMHFANKRV